MVHRAKVDRWLAAVLIAAALLPLALGAVILAGGIDVPVPASEAMPAALGLTALSGLIILVLWACYKTRYEITATELIIWFPPFRTALPLESLFEVFPSHNPLSAPAPSMDRLRINYRRKSGRKGFALISPRDKESFVRDLTSAAPHLRLAPEADCT
jgi:hypothetical protein